jgi:hypothetical protein
VGQAPPGEQKKKALRQAQDEPVGSKKGKSVRYEVKNQIIN